MARLLFITDYTEQFAYRLLRGIISYSSLSGKWVVYRMTLAEKRKLGIDGVVKWALGWKAEKMMKDPTFSGRSPCHADCSRTGSRP